MNKSKFFSKVTKYILAAMLALLPNTSWGLTEQKAVSLASGQTAKFSGLSKYLTVNDYSAWYVMDKSGKAVDVSGWQTTLGNVFSQCSNQTSYWKAGKAQWGLEDWREITFTTAGDDISNYQIVLLASSKEAFFDTPSEANAEKKFIFQFISASDAPLLSDYTGNNKLALTDFVADGSTSYTFDATPFIESLLSLPSSSDGTKFDVSSKKLYLRVNLLDKKGDKVAASGYTLKRNNKEIDSQTMSSWPNTDCKTNKGGFFYSNTNNEITKTDLKYTIEVPEGETISDYSIEVYLSDEVADVSNNILLQEPNLKAKVTCNLMAQSVKDNLTFAATDDASMDASKVYDFRQAFTTKTANVKLLTEENKARLCKALDVTDLSQVTDLYVRWKVTDKNGDPINGVTTSGLTLRKDQTTGKEVYYTWFSDNAANTLASALNPTFVFPTTLDWNDLRVSCVVSNTPLLEDENVKYGLVIKEPKNFNIKFNVSLEEAPILSDLDESYSQNLHKENVYVGETAIKNKKVTLLDVASQLAKFGVFDVDKDGNFTVSSSKPFYLRMSVYDKTTGALVSPKGFGLSDKDGNFKNSFSDPSFQWKSEYKSSKGLFCFYNTDKPIQASDLYYLVEFADGQDMTNCRFEISVSDNAPEIENYLVVTEPTIKGKLIYNILGATDAPFKHYKGYANADGDFEVINASKNQLRQKTYTWEYTFAVDNADNKSVELTLPLENFSTVGNPLEPFGYFRWYNYDTDEASANITADVRSGVENYLHAVKDEQGNAKGLLAVNLPERTNAWQGNVGVKYTRPNDSSWKGETIACDVSRYVDGMDATGSYLEHESTLSIRYIFHVIPAEKMAEEVRDYLIDAQTDSTYEDNKNITVGLNPNKSDATMTLRLNMKSYMYYFYPMTNPSRHVYYPASETKKRIFRDADFGKEIKKATHVFWRIYNGDRDRYFDAESNVKDFPRFYDVKINTLNNATWYDLDGKKLSDKLTFKSGDHFSVVAYAVAVDGSSCPIANFNCRYFSYYPKAIDEMGNEDATRRVAYLDKHFNNVAIISFDNDSPEQTLAAATNPMDNQTHQPSSWNKRSYGFVYEDLIDKSAGGLTAGEYYNPKHSPLHGEYGIYKTANVEGLSSRSDGYLWHDGHELHDRTYENTNGLQNGYFLYIDASDESRTIASAEFQANLCTGQQMAFTAAVADMTGRETKPQLMFRLFGLTKDNAGNTVGKTLLHSFSSGDLGNNVDNLTQGKWYQVYGRVTLQQDVRVENYSDFRIEIDNFSKGTNGADYSIDDIRIYTQPAKVDVVQDKPVCGGKNVGNIKLKIRAIHETLNAILGHKNTKIYFRFMREDGTPVEGDGFYSYKLTDKRDNTSTTVPGNKYATVDVYDSDEDCKNFEIEDGAMLETDEYGESYIVLGNKNYGLEVGQKYYVSVCTSADPEASDAEWGNPSATCSVYSDWFDLVGQTPMITDTYGKLITEYRVNCSGIYSITVKGRLETLDRETGAKIQLDGINFDWYLDGTAESNKVGSGQNEITLTNEQITTGDHQLYLKIVGEANSDGFIEKTIGGVTYLLCTEASPVKLRVVKDGPRLNFGFIGVDYPFNDSGFESSLRIGLPQIKKLVEQSTKNNTQGYLQIPLHSASYLSGATEAKLTFVDDSKTDSPATTDVFVATTNDPLWNATGANLLTKSVGTLRSEELDAIKEGTQSTLDLQFNSDVLNNFHEGYWYELRFVFEQRGETAETTNCPGESYFKLKIVPEYVTWRPTANGGMNACWNNDANWHRSSSAELYKNDYADYEAYVDNKQTGKDEADVKIPTIDNYVPMKFTKVTIDNLKGLPFPDLGNVTYRQSNGIATKLTNAKGNEATSYIQYDIMAYWDESDSNKGIGKDAKGKTVTSLPTGEEGDMSCEKFYANTCHQIYFKPQGELRDQCYLVYDKAWVEKELEPNQWYTMCSPLQYIYAGDMYVPSSNGRQETEAFQDIYFTDTESSASGSGSASGNATGSTSASGNASGSNTGKSLYSRSLYPVYQRAWMKSDVMEIAANGEYGASHYPTEAKTGDVDLKMGYWSHIYNKVDESYASGGDQVTFGGFSIKAGNSLLPKKQKDENGNVIYALLRLPKADTQYSYFDYEGNKPSKKNVTVTKKNADKFIASNAQGGNDGSGKTLVAYNNTENHLATMTQSLGDNSSEFYLVANPYTCSISLKEFFDANPGLQRAAWLVEAGVVKPISSTAFNKNDLAIQPTQAFFVKKVEGSSVDEVKFTAQMYVDRTITSGLQMASDYEKKVTVEVANAKGQRSMARIDVRTESSADYDADEDVDLLYDENLKDIPQVYTVAGSEAVAVNAVPSIEWIPMGIVTEKSDNKELVSLTLSGLRKLKTPLYLYDAADKSYTELHEGEAVSVEAGEHGRYFLTQSRGTITAIDSPLQEGAADEAHVKVYSPGAGMIVASALAGETLGRVEVFTLDGKLVHRYEMPGHQRMILRVPSGVYVVNATTEGSVAKVSRKLAVR